MLLERMIKNISSKDWYIRPEAVHQMIASAKELESKISSEPKSFFGFMDISEEEFKPDDYPVEDGCAIIEIIGATQKRCDSVDKYCGICSTEEIKAKISNAMESSIVKSILLFIDSPGGTVDGTQELSDFIFGSRGKKPLIAYTNGMMCSAAVFYGTACDKIIAVPSADIGSIGVYCTHFDFSGFYESMGIKASIIKAGKYKAVGNQFAPLSEDDRAVMQARVDGMYDAFLAAVARNRGCSKDLVASDMADARIFTATEAARIGLIDEVNYIEKISGYFEANSQTQTKDDPMSIFGKTEKITAAQLKEKDAELYSEVFEAGKVAGKAESADEQKAAMAEAEKTATEKERSRVSSIFELASESQREFAVDLVTKGTSVEDAKTALLKDAQATRTKALESFREGAAQSVDHTAEAKTNDTQLYVEKYNKDEKFAKLYENKGGMDALLKALESWNASSKIREEFGGNLDAFLAVKRNTKE